jgi:DNA repair exonuclease SbcCD ATPase subunit
MDNLLRTLFGNIDQVEVLLALLTGAISLLTGLLPLSRILRRFLMRLLGREEAEKPKTYSQRLTELTESLVKASSEVDSLLVELSQVAREREESVKELEVQITEMEQHEKQLQQRIQELKDIPVPVAERFAELVERGEKRSAWRDYALFGLGVVVSTAIAITLSLIGL